MPTETTATPTAAPPERIHYSNATPKQITFIEAKVSQSLGRCQSSLVSMLLERGDIEGFMVDDIENIWPNPSDWTVKQCEDYGEAHGIEGPDFEPEDITEEDWRDEIQDNAEAQEVYEWWPIEDSWMLKALREAGEPIIDNDWGEWWGRTCTGQAITLDPTFWDIFQDAVQPA